MASRYPLTIVLLTAICAAEPADTVTAADTATPVDTLTADSLADRDTTTTLPATADSVVDSTETQDVPPGPDTAPLPLWMDTFVPSTHGVKPSETVGPTAADTEVVADTGDSLAGAAAADTALTGDTTLAADSSVTPPGVDSLLYRTARRVLIERSPEGEAAIMLEIAEQLSAEGMYADAYALLEGMLADMEPEEPDTLVDATVVTDATESAAPADTTARRLEWTIRLEGDYYYYEDEDATVEEDWLADTTDLFWDTTYATDEDLSGIVDVRLDWYAGKPGIEQVSGRVYLSNTRARGEARGLWRLLNDFLDIELAGRGEVHLFEEYADSSDNVNAHLLIEPNNRRRLAPLTFALPFECEAELHKYSRADYNNAARIEFTPRLDFAPVRSQWLFAAGAEVEYTRNDSLGEELDLLRYGPCLSVGAFGRVVLWSADVCYIWELYPRASTEMIAKRKQELEILTDLSARIGSWLEVGLEARVAYSRHLFEDNVQVSTLLGPEERYYEYVLEGPEAWITPSLTLAPGRLLQGTVGVTYDAAHVPYLGDRDTDVLTYDPVYIDDWYDAYEPFGEVRFDGRRVSFDVRVGYRLKDVSEEARGIMGIDTLGGLSVVEIDTLNYSDDSHGVETSVSVYWRPTSWLTVSVGGTYDYRRFRPYGPDAPDAHNRSVTANAEFRFPR